jgi:hypothetical protein
MSLPKISTYHVNTKEIALSWHASPKSSIKKWNLYGSPSAPINMADPHKGVDISGFTVIVDGIANVDTPLTPGSVFIKLDRVADLEIGEEDPYYFILTSIDASGNESVISKEGLHAVPLADDYFVDEAGDPVNVVYKSFEFTLNQTTNWDSDRYLDVVALLGRPAKLMQIKQGEENSFQIRLNSFNNDSLTIELDDVNPLDLDRGEMKITKIWFHKQEAGSAKIRMIVAA